MKELVKLIAVRWYGQILQNGMCYPKISIEFLGN